MQKALRILCRKFIMLINYNDFVGCLNDKTDKSIFSEYAEAWCKANNKELSDEKDINRNNKELLDEKDINRVITDVIGYCRKKIKKELKDA